MRILLEEVARHTNLAKRPSLSWWETIKNWFSSEGIPESGADSQVVREFVPLFSFVEAPKDKTAPIDDYGKAIENVSNTYSRLFDDNKLNELSAKPEEDRNKELGLNRATETINSLTKPFKDMTFIADLLKQPIDNLKALFGADTIKQIGEKWKLEIVPLARKAEQGYPFESSETNADFTNLREYLAKGKGLSKFYEETLKKYFDGPPGQLKPKEPNNFPFNNEFLDYLNKALTLREALFSKGDDVKFSYNFELLNPNDALVEITIDGVTISSTEKPSSPIDFPAGSGMGSGVIIKASSTTGTTSTSGTSANTSSSSVNSSNTSVSRFLQNSNSSSSGDEKSFPGPWGLFRFMDAAGATKESDKVYKLSYRLRSGKVIEAKITAQGVDPFNKEIYKLRAPENILK
jgi:type VI protein secretion system component VasK